MALAGGSAMQQCKPGSSTVTYSGLPMLDCPPGSDCMDDRSHDHVVKYT